VHGSCAGLVSSARAPYFNAKAKLPSQLPGHDLPQHTETGFLTLRLHSALELALHRKMLRHGRHPMTLPPHLNRTRHLTFGLASHNLLQHAQRRPLAGGVNLCRQLPLRSLHLLGAASVLPTRPPDLYPHPNETFGLSNHHLPDHPKPRPLGLRSHLRLESCLHLGINTCILPPERGAPHFNPKAELALDLPRHALAQHAESCALALRLHLRLQGAPHASHLNSQRHSPNFHS